MEKDIGEDPEYTSRAGSVFKTYKGEIWSLVNENVLSNQDWEIPPEWDHIEKIWISSFKKGTCITSIINLTIFSFPMMKYNSKPIDCKWLRCCSCGDILDYKCRYRVGVKMYFGIQNKRVRFDFQTLLLCPKKKCGGPPFSASDKLAGFVMSLGLAVREYMREKLQCSRSTCPMCDKPYLSPNEKEEVVPDCECFVEGWFDLYKNLITRVPEGSRVDVEMRKMFGRMVEVGCDLESIIRGGEESRERSEKQWG